MNVAPQARIKVMSVLLGVIGNRTYGEFLSRALRDSAVLDLEASWESDDREFHARLFNRLMFVRSPLRWVNERNLDFMRVRRELGYAYFGRRILDRKFHRFRPDLLHFNTQTVAFLAPDYIARVPTVITSDQSAEQIAVETPPKWRWTQRPSVLLERSPLRAARAVVVLSDWAARSLIAGHDLAPERVRVVPQGVDLRAFAGMPASRAQKRGPRKLLFVGVDFERKGGPDLVRMFLERFADRDVELHLMTKEQRVHEHPRVVVHRDVHASSPAWTALYAEADLFVLPTRSDASPNSYIEAMAAGLPAIGTSVGAAAEIITNDETGYLVESNDMRAFGDRIDALLSQPENRQRLGDNGRRRVARDYDATVNAARLEKIFVEAACSPVPCRS